MYGAELESFKSRYHTRALEFVSKINTLRLRVRHQDVVKIFEWERGMQGCRMHSLGVSRVLTFGTLGGA